MNQRNNKIQTGKHDNTFHWDEIEDSDDEKETGNYVVHNEERKEDVQKSCYRCRYLGRVCTKSCLAKKSERVIGNRKFTKFIDTNNYWMRNLDIDRLDYSYNYYEVDEAAKFKNIDKNSRLNVIEMQTQSLSDNEINNELNFYPTQKEASDMREIIKKIVPEPNNVVLFLKLSPIDKQARKKENKKRNKK